MVPTNTASTPRSVVAGQAFVDRRGQHWLVEGIDRPGLGDDASMRLKLQFAAPDTREADYVMSLREFRALARARGFRAQTRVAA